MLDLLFLARIIRLLSRNLRDVVHISLRVLEIVGVITFISRITFLQVILAEVIATILCEVVSILAISCGIVRILRAVVHELVRIVVHRYVKIHGVLEIILRIHESVRFIRDVLHRYA